MNTPLTRKQIKEIPDDAFGAVRIEVREAARQLRRESALLQSRSAAMTRCEHWMGAEARRRRGA